MPLYSPQIPRKPIFSSYFIYCKADVRPVTSIGRYYDIAPDTRESNTKLAETRPDLITNYTHDSCERPCRRQLFVNCRINIYRMTILGTTTV